MILKEVRIITKEDLVSRANAGISQFKRKSRANDFTHEQECLYICVSVIYLGKVPIVELLQNLMGFDLFIQYLSTDSQQFCSLGLIALC